MTKTAKKKGRGEGPRPAKPTRAVSTGTGAEEPRSYVCTVCGGKKALRNSKNEDTFLVVPNGGRICKACVRGREAEELKAGRITLGLEYRGAAKQPGWYAVSASGGFEAPLIREAGQNDAQVVTAPRFRHEGHLWSGRVYKTGMAAFQRNAPRAERRRRKRPVPAGVATAGAG